MNSFDILKTMKDRKIVIIIPIYNNAKTIAPLISETKKYCSDIIVINDGSTDGTNDVLSSIEDIDLISYDCNKGKGYALKQGFKRAKALGFSYAITMDGDMQHLPSELRHLLLENIKSPGSVIIGARKNIGEFKRSLGSRFANRFSNLWFTIHTWKRIKDTQSGFRLYPVKKMWWLSILSSRYEAEIEILLLYSWHFVNIKEVDVSVYYHPVEERVSSFRGGRDFARISIVNILATVIAVFYGWPLTILKFLFNIFKVIFAIVWFFIIIFIIMTPLSFFLILFVKDDNKKNEYIKRGINFCSHIVISQMKMIYKISSANHENEDFKKPALIICNHQSHFDILVLQSINNNQIFLTNDWAWNNPYYGHIIHLANFYPLSIGIESLICKFKESIRNNNSIVIFPEGTRSLDLSIGRFHQGAFLFADALDLDIIPIILYGTGKILPKHGRKLNQGRIHYEIDRRITKEEYSKLGSYKEIASYFRSYYNKRYLEIRNRIEQDV